MKQLFVFYVGSPKKCIIDPVSYSTMISITSDGTDDATFIETLETIENVLGNFPSKESN